MIKLEKIHTLTIENHHNINTHLVIEILSVLHSAYMIFRDQDKIGFYINNYMNWNQLNQLYNLD